MFTHSLNPILLNLGFLEIRWYGLLYALGFVITYLFLRAAIKQKKLPLKMDDIDSLLVYLIIGTILGARLFEILFYNLSYYLSNPLQIVAVWQGGLSFHGGLVGVFIALIIFAKKKKVDFWLLSDLVVLPAALALALGRIGNFINGELVGRVSSVPWAVKFQNADGFRHPSQLYESFKNLLIFVVLLFFRNKNHQPGFLFALFLTFYGFLRFMVEFVREPEVLLGFITMGQLLSIPVFLIGVWLVIKKK